MDRIDIQVEVENVLNMFLSILWVVILPIVIGFIIKRLFPKFTKSAVEYLPAFSSLAIITIVGVVISASSAKLMAGGFLIVLVVILHNLCGLGLGYGVGTLMRMPSPKRRAVSIEVGMQNSRLASNLANIHFTAFPIHHPRCYFQCVAQHFWGHRGMIVCKKAIIYSQQERNHPAGIIQSDIIFFEHPYKHSTT